MKFTILVVTYNSEKTISETLTSISNQDFKNFEVIISDDGSSDNTVEICENWAKSQPFKVDIIANQINQGVTANCNIGAKECKTPWIKLIAGDDLLLNDALSKFNDYIESNPEAKIICSRVNVFRDEDKEKNTIITMPVTKKLKLYNLSAMKQFQHMLEENFVMAASICINTALLKEIGYFDSRFKMVEDYPLWIRILKHGVRLNFLNAVTALYRKSSQSISGVEDNQYTNKTMLDFHKLFYTKIYREEVKSIIRRMRYLTWLKLGDLSLNESKKFKYRMLKKFHRLFKKIVRIVYL